MKTTKKITKKKTGRPTAITAKTITKLESILKIGGTIQEATAYAEIGERTYYDNLKSNENFRRKMQQAKHYATVAAKNVVVQSILKDKDLNTAKWWLERRTKEFQPKATFEGDDKNPITVKIVDYGKKK